MSKLALCLLMLFWISSKFGPSVYFFCLWFQNDVVLGIGLAGSDAFGLRIRVHGPIIVSLFSLSIPMLELFAWLFWGFVFCLSNLSIQPTYFEKASLLNRFVDLVWALWKFEDVMFS